MFGGRLVLRNTTALIGLLALIVGAAQWRGGPTALAAGTISGTVFQDYNGNGTQDLNTLIDNAGGGQVRAARDQGLGGVVVTAYNSAGAAVGTTTAAADGSYTLSASGSGPYRVEFSNLPVGFQPGPLGTNNGSTVRFVNDGVTASVDLGIILPGEYCQDNPDLITSCFRAGPQANVTDASVQSFPYSAGSTTVNGTLNPYREPLTHNLSVDSANTGAVWGLDHSRTRGIIYAASFFKKHAGFGPGADGIFGTSAAPGDDPGAVYLIDQTTGQIVDAFTLSAATKNEHDTTFYIADGYDKAWDAVGKTSLGGVAVSEDETTLYVMSLEDRTLYALNANTGAVVAQAPIPGIGTSTVPAPPLPAAAPGAPALPATCPAQAIRPFAVQFERGQLYVGITCTGEGSATVDTYTESSAPPNGRFDHNNPTERNSVVDRDDNGVYNTGDARQLQAYVYRVNPQTLAFDSAPYFQAALNYPRGIANANGQPPAEWRPWVPGFSYISMGELTIYYPQPWLTDITFDGQSMILALRDRTGDTSGYFAPANPNAADPLNELWTGVGVGDVLRACPNAQGVLTLESNGSCGGVTATPTPGGPALTPQGPGGGEFYFDDGYGITGGSTVNHDEVSIGGSTQVPGHPDAVVSTFDAFPLRGGGVNEVFNGGFRWYSNSGANAGRFQKAYVLFETENNVDPLTFGKANGLGDVIVLCDAAPIEIGNRVWRDDDLDGVQDANEPVIPGVTLQLFEGSTLIGTAVTDANGNYLFSAYRTPGASTAALRYGLDLKPNTQYTVRIPNVTGASQQAALLGLLPTLAHAGSPGSDMRDSDGVYAPILNLVETTLTTGGVGANNHTYDFGFVSQATAIVLESFSSRLVSGGAVVEWRTSIELDTWGFHLYRSATGQLADAVRVTDALILARGNSSTGASYSFVDPTATAGPYTYWLEEYTRDGARHVYGPETAELAAKGTVQAWLPAVAR